MDVRDYLRVVRRQWVVIAVTTMAIGAVALIVSGLTPSVATTSASTIVLISERSGSDAFGDLLPADSSVPDREIQTQMVVLRNLPLTRSDLQKADIDLTPEEVATRVTVAPTTQNLPAGAAAGVSLGNAITITATDSDSSRAARIVQLYAQEYVKRANERRRLQLEEVATALESQVAEAQASSARTIAEMKELLAAADTQLPPSQRQAFVLRLDNQLTSWMADESESSDLQELLQRVRVSGQTGLGESRVLTSAKTTESVTGGPAPLRDTGFGLALGLLLGVGFAFVADFAQDRAWSCQEVSETTGLSVIGCGMPSTSTAAASVDGHSADEPFDLAAVTIARETGGSGGAVTLVIEASAAPQDRGPSAQRLAGAFARLGARVAIVDTDMRSGATSADSALGLSALLAAEEFDPTALQLSSPIGLLEIGPGSPSAHPLALLGSSRMGALLSMLCDQGYLVVVSVAPSPAWDDAAVLATHADFAVLVVDAQKTTRTVMSAGAASLSRVPMERKGVVATFAGAEKGAR